MNPDEYRKMYTLEDRYWWFVGRRRLALDLLKRALRDSSPEGGWAMETKPARLAGLPLPQRGATVRASMRGGGRGGGENETVTKSSLSEIPACRDDSLLRLHDPSTEGAKEPLVAPRILDLGCGTGVVLRELGAWSEPLGVDMSPLALEFCRERGLRDLVQADGIALPLRSDTVDAVIGLDIFEHIEDDKAAFAECFRVLKPGGVIVLSVPAFRSLWGPHDVALMHFRRYRRREVRLRLEAAGFSVRRAGYSVFFLFPIVCLWRMFEKRKKGPARASLVGVPSWANRLLIGIQDLETSLIRSMDLPWGSSVVAVGQKPDAGLRSGGRARSAEEA